MRNATVGITKLLTLCAGPLLACGLLLGASFAFAQQDQPAGFYRLNSFDLTVTYVAEYAEQSPGNCGCFWLKGGSAEGSFLLWRDLGISAKLMGDHAEDVANGVDINQISMMAGPSFAHALPSKWEFSSSNLPRQPQIFGEALFGWTHAFNGIFPTSTGFTSGAGSFTVTSGAGVNLPLSRRFGLRLIEVDYARMALPNQTANTQNDLRLSTGVTCHFGKQSR